MPFGQWCFCTGEEEEEGEGTSRPAGNPRGYHVVHAYVLHACWQGWAVVGRTSCLGKRSVQQASDDMLRECELQENRNRRNTHTTTRTPQQQPLPPLTSHLHRIGTPDPKYGALQVKYRRITGVPDPCGRFWLSWDPVERKPQRR